METTGSEEIFSKIIRREIPAEIVYEDAETLAFLDIHPNHPGHTLVVPKRYARNILDMDEQMLESVIKTVQKVAQAIKDGLPADGVTVAMNNELAGGQEVFYAHMHVIPRYEGDGFQHFPHTEYKPGEAAEVAEKIRAHFAKA